MQFITLSVLANYFTISNCDVSSVDKTMTNYITINIIAHTTESIK